MSRHTVSELINLIDPAWPLVQQWVAEARNPVELLPAEREAGMATLHHLQVTTRSPMGAIALESGGLLIDHGWLRFLGSGHERMRGNLFTWNSQSGLPEYRYCKDALIIAHDVLGGFFALNGGAFPGKLGTAFYFAPDSLQWEDTGKSYSDLLQWALFGDLSLFYETMRWSGWENDVSVLSGDQGISIYPFLFLNRDLPLANRSRRAVPMQELWDLSHDLAQQLKHLLPGTPAQIVLKKDEQEND